MFSLRSRAVDHGKEPSGDSFFRFALFTLSPLLSSYTNTCTRKKKDCVTLWRGSPLLPSLRLLTAPLPQQTHARLKHAAARKPALRTSSDVATPQLQRVAEEEQIASSTVLYHKHDKRSRRDSSSETPNLQRGQSSAFLRLECLFRHGQARQNQQVRLHEPAQ